ncbi:ribose 1,5-bisphosphokinase [Marinobacter sp.]|uniref:ribose 1,5-bisphosphokinase n=1 Tax=Marinobacter sp. TaxID=50741 RepID=UPI003565B8E8
MTGKLFYLMGPSGSGKDSLLRMCRHRLADRPLMIAHRYITREPDPDGENHVALTQQEYNNRSERGLFAMEWQANGLCYGIGMEVDLWLAQGCNVLVNGSRAYIDQAREHYGSTLVPVLVRVNQDVLMQRLLNRGRESLADIERRILRASRFAGQVPPDTRFVDNNGELERAFRQLAGILNVEAPRTFEGMIRGA